MTRLALPLILLMLGSDVAAAETRLDGSLPDALGYYRIDLPEGWQAGGRLIVYNHGFDMQRPSADDLPATAPSEAIRQAWLAQGYALAAGSYGNRGWALFDLERAQLALLDAVRTRAGAPGEIVLFGGSLGGLVSLRTAEILHANGTPAAGVLAACPPAGGARTWDQAVDVRLLFDAVCEASPLPSGSEPLPWLIDYATIPEDIDNIDDPDALLALASAANRIRQCTGLFQPAVFDTAAQLARRAQLKSLLGLSSDDFLKLQLSYALYPLADLVRGPDKLDGHSAFDNRFVDYADAAINTRIRRVERDPLAAVKLSAVSDPRGGWGNTRVLAIHSDRDELVFTEHLSALSPIPLAGTPAVTAVVRESSPGHCQFTATELDVALQALRRWIDQPADPPSSTRLAADCAARGAGERCAYDAGYEVAALDTRIRPRGLLLDTPRSTHSGSWFDPGHNGEGMFVEMLPDGEHATVTWYTYPPAGSSDQQGWVVGRGRIGADGIHVADAYQYRGARFGEDFRSADLIATRWGEFTLAFEGCGDYSNEPLAMGRLRFKGPPGYGSGDRPLRQLTLNAEASDHCLHILPPPPHPQSGFTGAWFRGPEAAGEGIQFQLGQDGLAVLVWYSYDPQGRPAWMIGTSREPAPDNTWRFTLTRPRGSVFGEGFDSAAIDYPEWGRAELHFEDCDHARLSWTASESGWPSGSLALLRLTRVAGSAACTTALR